MLVRLILVLKYFFTVEIITSLMTASHSCVKKNPKKTIYKLLISVIFCLFLARAMQQ